MKHKWIYIFTFLLLLNLSACTGSAPFPAGGENSGGGYSIADTSPDNTSNSPSNTNVAMASPPPAQPTQPVIIGVHLLTVNGSVLLPGKKTDPLCGKDDKHPVVFPDTIPEVDSWIKDNGSDWVLKFVLGKKESEEDNVLPFAVDRCGNFTGRLYITIGGTDPNQCNGDSQAMFTASYTNAAGITYIGNSQVYSCSMSPPYPDAIIKLHLPYMMENPKNISLQAP